MTIKTVLPSAIKGTGVCPRCYALGLRWDEPREDGTCYECGKPLTAERRENIELCMSLVDKLRTLTREKQALLERLYRVLQSERNKELRK